MSKKAFIIIALVLGFASRGSAQSFKEVYESLAENDRFSNMMNLRHYLENNTEHAVPYFLLGEIFNDYMCETDPLLLYQVLESDYLQLKTYYGLAKFRLDDKQARQDRDLFGNIEIITDKKKVSYEDIVAEIETRMDVAETYYSHATQLHENYYNFIHKYNSCLFEFRAILGTYANYKDLYLTATNELVQRVETIAADFDSALVNFDIYKASSVHFPHLMEVQDYHLEPIITYRLEGLVENDLTSKTVKLWDFGSWAKDFLSRYNNEIVFIREELVNNDIRLKNEIENMLSSPNFIDRRELYLVDIKFQNLIGQYDYASLANQLLNYQKEKMKFVAETRREVNDTSSHKPFYLISKLRYFQSLGHLQSAVNENVSDLKESTSLDNVGKYLEFFQKQYNGMDGFLRWCEIEKYRNREIFNNNLDHLKSFISQKVHEYDFNDSSLVLNNKSMALGTQYWNHDSIYSDTVLVEAVYPLKNRRFYQLVHEINKDTIDTESIVFIQPGGKVEWQYFPDQGAGTTIDAVQTLEDSTLLCLSSKLELQADSSWLNRIVLDRIDWLGKTMKSFSYSSKSTPQFFWYDDINAVYVIVEQGSVGDDSLYSKSSLLVKKFTDSDSLLWATEIDLKGEVENLIPTGGNFLMVTNFTDLRYNDTGFSSANGAIGSVLITGDGIVSDLNAYEGPGEIRSYNEYKLSGNTINIIGEMQRNEAASSNFYLLTDEKGVPVYSNNNEWEYKHLKVNP